MPQPKSTTRRKSAAKPGSARKAGARKSAAGKKRTGTGAATKRGTASRAGASRAGASGSPEDVVRANLKALRDALASPVSQLNLMMVSRHPLQEVPDHARH